MGAASGMAGEIAGLVQSAKSARGAGLREKTGEAGGLSGREAVSLLDVGALREAGGFPM